MLYVLGVECTALLLCLGHMLHQVKPSSGTFQAASGSQTIVMQVWVPVQAPVGTLPALCIQHLSFTKPSSGRAQVHSSQKTSSQRTGCTYLCGEEVQGACVPVFTQRLRMTDSRQELSIHEIVTLAHTLHEPPEGTQQRMTMLDALDMQHIHETVTLTNSKHRSPEGTRQGMMMLDALDKQRMDHKSGCV